MSFEPIIIDIAGIAASIACETRAMAEAVADGRGPFLTAADRTETDIRLRAGFARLEVPSPHNVIFVSGGLWALHRLGQDYQFTFTSDVYGGAPYKTMVLDETFTTGEILVNQDYFGESVRIDPLQYPADELLWIHRLSRAGGVELHACGVVDTDGDGYLFIGHSGAGKSTIARLWESAGATILSDDRTVVRRKNDQFMIYGTPWHGEAQLAAAGEAPLRGVFFVEHGTRNDVVELSVPDATAQFFARCFPVFHDAASIAAGLEFYEQLAEATPCLELRFVPDARVIDFVRAAGRTPA